MNKRRIEKYMRDQLEIDPDFFDIYDCHEVNSTKLAEDAADELDLYDENDKISQEVFEIALKISEERDWFDDK